MLFSLLSWPRAGLQPLLYPAQLINIYSFYMCDLYLYAYILFATHVCMLVYCVNYKLLYTKYIIEEFLASTFCGGNLTKNPLEVLWKTVCRVCRGIYFLKHSSVKIIPKPLCSQKKTSPRMGWITFSLQSFRQDWIPLECKLKKTLEGFCKFSLDRACRVSNPREGWKSCAYRG